jgi:hypothetical protein
LFPAVGLTLTMLTYVVVLGSSAMLSRVAPPVQAKNAKTSLFTEPFVHVGAPHPAACHMTIIGRRRVTQLVYDTNY